VLLDVKENELDIDLKTPACSMKFDTLLNVPVKDLNAARCSKKLSLELNVSLKALNNEECSVTLLEAPIEISKV
jgi:hypothetical protein